MTATIVISAAAVLLLAAGFALTAWLIGRPEGGHHRPGRWSRTYWWARAWLGWLGWRRRNGVARAQLWLRRRRENEPPEVHHEEYGFVPAPVTGEVMPSAPGQHDSETPGHGLRVTGRPGQPGDNTGQRAGLAGRDRNVLPHVAALGAGGARPSPALPPTVTDALASGWAIHSELGRVEFDTAWFAAVSGSA